jgi:hypothetical protein
VPMMTIEEIRADPRVRKSFATDERLLRTYNAWLGSHGIPAGDIRAVTEAHARHYIQWRGLLHAQHQEGITGQAFYARAPESKDKEEMALADRDLGMQLKWLAERKQANSSFTGYVRERLKDALRFSSPVVGRVLIDPGKAPLTAREREFLDIATNASHLPQACHALFADYAHDSRAGFRPLGHHEPSLLTGGYLRFRHVFKESVHAEPMNYQLANEGLVAAQAAGNALVDFSKRLWNAAVHTYQAARDAGVSAARSTRDAASRAYQSAEQRVWQMYLEAERAMYGELYRRY